MARSPRSAPRCSPPAGTPARSPAARPRRHAGEHRTHAAARTTPRRVRPPHHRDPECSTWSGPPSRCAEPHGDVSSRVASANAWLKRVRRAPARRPRPPVQRVQLRAGRDDRGQVADPMARPAPPARPRLQRLDRWRAPRPVQRARTPSNRCPATRGSRADAHQLTRRQGADSTRCQERQPLLFLPPGDLQVDCAAAATNS